jgi:hypothetical protein
VGRAMDNGLGGKERLDLIVALAAGHAGMTDPWGWRDRAKALIILAIIGGVVWLLWAM